MNNHRIAQGILVVFGLMLAVALFLWGKNPATGVVPDKANSFQEAEASGAWDDNVLGLVQDLLREQDFGPEHETLQEEYSPDADTSLVRALAYSWDTLNYDLLAGYYYEKLAMRNGKTESWQKAADNLNSILGRLSDSLESKKTILAHTINAYEQVQKRDSTNLDAAADVAYLKLQHQVGMPMAAIATFQQNLQKDSAHQKTLLYYGLALYRIGNMEQSVARLGKAANMFLRLIALEPDRSVYYQFLGDTYKAMGAYPKAIEAYTQHKALLTDPKAIEQTEFIIEELKKNL